REPERDRDEDRHEQDAAEDPQAATPARRRLLVTRHRARRRGRVDRVAVAVQLGATADPSLQRGSHRRRTAPAGAAARITGLLDGSALDEQLREPQLESWELALRV